MNLFSRYPAGVILFALLLCSCISQDRYTLPEIYNRAAQSHVRNPVVMIHGLGGSMLMEKQSEAVVWGAFTGTGQDPNSPAGIRQLALPMEPAADPDFSPADLARIRDNVYATGPLQKIRLDVLGLGLSVDVYRQILQTLGVGGYRDQAVNPGQIDYGPEHYTCFTFFYDWRRDIVENSRSLGRFLSETAAYVAEQDQRYGIEREKMAFDIVAHSLGGLVARYYLRYGSADVCAQEANPRVTWAGAESISRLILISPPNTGAVDALESLVQGRRYSWLLPKFQPALIATYPSVYQLLPRPRHRIFAHESGSRPKTDLYNARFWEKNQWGIFSPSQQKYLAYLLPEEKDPKGVARAYVQAALTRARSVHQAMDITPATPCPAEIYLFTSNTVPTAGRVMLTGTPGGYTPIFKASELHAPGDGTVTTASALADERQGQDWKPWVRTAIPFQGIYMMGGDHLAITSSPRFTNNLLHLLLAMPPKRHPPKS